MIFSDQKHNTWSVLTKYKMLSDKVSELRTKAWLDLPSNEDIQDSLHEAEEELSKLKTWIEMNFEVKRAD